MIDFERYWQDCVRQDREALRTWFCPDARISWPSTGEIFTVDEFLLANCAYPGHWAGALLRVTPTPDGAVTECSIASTDGSSRCHVASFFTLHEGKIAALTEYYADDGPPPAWRRELLNP